MFDRDKSALFVICLLLGLANRTAVADSVVPEPFRGFDDDSTYTISYADVNAVLDMAVLNVGRSTREKASSAKAVTGTRMAAKVNVSTIDEGNRFYFESFEKNEETRQLLSDIRHSLEQVPDEVPLKYFSRTEQLAYWLNLYNVTLIDEILEVYPKRSLKKELTGKNSILSNDALTVAGIPLSLNDIEYTILKENYDSNPLIIYGLYQGIIGGPNIRKRAYTGENVYRYLADNAAEFINSNRGTHARDEQVFRVSSLYERNKTFFRDFENGLREHLLAYLQGPERGELLAASKIRPDIDDWSIADLYGSRKPIGGSLATNRAAMMDATINISVTDHVTTSTPTEAAAFVVSAGPLGRFSPEVLVHLREINQRREAAAEQGATVTVDDIVPESVKKSDDEGQDER